MRPWSRINCNLTSVSSLGRWVGDLAWALRRARIAEGGIERRQNRKTRRQMGWDGIGLWTLNMDVASTRMCTCPSMRPPPTLRPFLLCLIAQKPEDQNRSLRLHPIPHLCRGYCYLQPPFLFKATKGAGGEAWRGCVRKVAGILCSPKNSRDSLRSDGGGPIIAPLL